MSRIDFRPGTKRYFIAQYAERGTSWIDCYYELRPKVIEQLHPWIFKANPPRGTHGSRTPKLIPAQLIDLKHEIRRVYAELNRAADDADVDTSADEIPLPAPVPVPETETPKPEKPQSEMHFFVSEWRRVRRWIKERATATGASPVDSLDSMRPVLEAKRGIASGISAKAMLHAMTMHWSPETRSDAGIENIDFIDEADSDMLPEGFHRISGYVTKLAEARIPIMLVGPAGTGKSGMLRRVANDIMDIDYAETPMTAGATPSWLLGRMTFPNGAPANIEIPEASSIEELTRLLVQAVAKLGDTTSYTKSKFLDIFENGGMFNFEEIDASDPNMLIVCNNALALQPGEVFFNPVNGESYVKSPDFIAAATANTFGLGASRDYTGRERLDFATIDRFRMGRTFVELDEKLVDHLAFS